MKDALSFLGFVFIICGAIYGFFNIFFFTIPGSDFFYVIVEIIYAAIFPALIISVGVALKFISNAL
ncbi:MAG: hypothetical protein ACFFA4_06450 [Promethearchaeota archaeon]